MTYTSLGKRSSSYAHNSPSSRKKPRTGLPTTLQQKLAEERKRMEKLQNNLQKIRRQSSLLAEDLSATHLSLNYEEAGGDEGQEEGEEESMDIFLSAAPSSKEDILKSLGVRSTDEQKSSCHTFSVNGRTSLLLFSQNNKPSSSSTTTLSSSPRRIMNNNTSNNADPTAAYNTMATPVLPNRIISPKRTIINDISSANLRSAETISTPGGSRVSNRFWKEIHGLNARRESASPSASNNDRTTKRSAPNVRRISTVNNNKSWANDDGFWSADNSPVASSLNNKLFQLARQNDKEHEKPTRIRHSFTRKLFDADVAEEDSLFHNPLFRKAAQSEQQAYNTNQHTQVPTPPPPPPPLLPAKANAINNSLSAEIEVANKRDEIKKRNNIPTMNASVLAELKAKHKEKLIDDTDSYKFA
ncbi:hypothetical protein BD408DRAFT_105095 [Parasitella parasitica]|nr:hypothetical protein BD408DRAFT_105095 [Parasitella parasitica]